MSFNWAEFLTLAEALLRDPNSPGPEEASLRSAISRAYYASYCSARNFGIAKGGLQLSKMPRDHQLVINYFKSSRDKNRRQIGTELRLLRRCRNDADYDDVVRSLVSVAQVSVARARNVLNILNAL